MAVSTAKNRDPPHPMPGLTKKRRPGHPQPGRREGEPRCRRCRRVGGGAASVPWAGSCGKWDVRGGLGGPVQAG